MHGIIYLATNTKNGRMYVGQTTRGLATRITEHEARARRGDALPFCRALRKYGRGAFTFDIIRRCRDQAELDAAEREEIEQRACRVPHGYNVEHGGALPMSDETRTKIAETRRARGLSRGERNGNAKLTAEHARAIFVSDERQTAIAERFGVTQVVVSQIKNRKTWASATAGLTRGDYRRSLRSAAARIRKRYNAGGVTMRQLAAEYDTSSSAISYIVNATSQEAKG